MYWEKWTHGEHHTIVLFQEKSPTGKGGQVGGGSVQKNPNLSYIYSYILKRIWLTNKAKTYTSPNEMMCVA